MAARTHDYDIRAAIGRELLARGIPRRDIRHEITLDSFGSGGRADIVVIVGDRLAGIEIKSGSDNLARCVEQLDAYARAFDLALFVVDNRIAGRLERAERRGVRRSAVTVANIWSALAGESVATIDGMARLLWASELQALAPGATSRPAALDWVRENVGLDELRRAAIAALRNRVPNQWEAAFWARFERHEIEPGRAA